VQAGVWDFIITAFTSIFIIVDPPGNIPVFLGLTGDYDDERRRHAARTAALTCFGVLSLFAVAGPAIMSLFNISIPAMRIGGGVILFFIGFQMLHARRTRTKYTPEEQVEWAGRDDVGLVPLGIPMLAGPGSITAVLVLSQTGPHYAAVPIVLASVAATSALTYLMLIQSHYLTRLLGQVGLNVLVRLMGLLLAIIGVQFVLDGLAGAAPVILRHTGAVA
jgi:multiple antibiotic resistance protein